MEYPIAVQGRVLFQSEVEGIRQLIAERPGWSRRALSREIARRWEWRNGAGELKDMSARLLLNKLESRALIQLPPRRWLQPAHRPPARAAGLFERIEPEAIVASLEELGGLEILPLERRDPRRALFDRYLARYHYLSYKGPAGENLAYLARDARGRDLACLLFSAAAWKARERDAFIGWSRGQRERRLHLLANNSRFLILPWVRVPHLASHLLSRVTRRLSADWQAKYGHTIYLAETFVEQERFRGVCYRPANWRHVGATQGRSRQDSQHRLQVPIKDIYLY